MSKTLREYPSINFEGREMAVTAFVGGKFGYSIQFTINGQYCAMAENQVRDLRDTLTKRLLSRKGYKATDGGNHETIEPKEIV